MNIVAWDTSRRDLTAVLVQDGAVVDRAHADWDGGKSRHAEHLVPTIQSLIVHNGWRFEEIDAVAYVAGPGSFTGLRIGAATAKGISMAWSIPVLALSTTEVIAAAAPPERCHGATVLAALDARKGRYYAAPFSLGASVARLADDVDVDPSELAAIARHRNVEWLIHPPLGESILVSGTVGFTVDSDDVARGIARCAVAAAVDARWEAKESGPFYLRAGDIGESRKRPRFEPREP